MLRLSNHTFLALTLCTLAGRVEAQCPQLYDYYGTPSAAPQWFSCSGTSFTLLIASPQTIGAYTVDWGDGSPVQSGASLIPPLSITHVYAATVANYTVTFQETAIGCTVVGTLVMEQSTSASIQIPVGGLTQVCAPHPVDFINSSTNNSPNTVYTWDFGDGSPLQVYNSTNNGQTVTHTYLKGTVSCETMVRLYAENHCNTLQGGPSIATFNPIRVWDIDSARITPSATLLCYPDTVVTFLNTTLRNCLPQGNIYQRFEYWNFGDYWGTGQDSIFNWAPWPPTFPHTIAYPGVGTYTAMLLDSNYCGVDTAYVTITIVPPPTVSLVATPDPVCAGGTVLFQQTTTGGANFFQWNFGQGGGWQTTGPGDQSHTYNTPGSYTVSYSASIQGATPGCVGTASVVVDVLPSPTAQFVVTPDAACDSLTATFTNTSQNAAGQVWDFGDGTTSTLQDPPPHSYSTPGSYTVTLTVTNLQGCSHSTTHTVNVFDPPQLQIIAQDLCEGGTAHLSAQVTTAPGNPVTQWDWDLGDGSMANTAMVAHQYATAGPYTVVLTVTTPYCGNTTSQNIVVDPKPVAAFAPDVVIGCSPLTVSFMNSSTGAVSYQWDLGDGTTSTAFAPSHTYLNPGPGTIPRTVTLVATSSSGCQDTATVVVQVAPGVVAAFNDDAVPGCAPMSVTFTDLSTGAGSYTWDFGDGSTSTLADPVHLFQNTTYQLQTFNVTLVALSPAGCSDTVVHPVPVYPAPNLTFSAAPPDGCTPHTVTIPPVLGAVQYNWDFGDGTTGTGPFPVHTYTNPSLLDTTFHITLIAANAFGCFDTVVTQTVVHPLPIAQFVPSVPAGCQPLLVDFQDLSLGAVAAQWQFGDGSSLNTMPGIVSHAYTHSSLTPVTYPVQLIATSAYGCADTTVVPVDVYPQVVADFHVDSAGCSPFTVDLLDQSTGASAQLWDLGNGLVLNTANPSYTYVNNSTVDQWYTITLTATSPWGCQDTTSHTILVAPVPSAAFTPSPVVQQFPLSTVSVTDQSSSGPWSYAWDFGDGATASTQNPTPHTYATWGQYAIQLVVSGSYCSDTAMQMVEVLPPLPIADFEGSGEGCAPLKVVFTNTSQQAISYHWDFGDGGTSSADDPEYVYVQPGTYTVTLTAFGIGGGVDVAVHEGVVVVHEGATAFFVLQPSYVIAPSQPVFTYNLSSGASAYIWDFGDGTSSNEFDPVHFYTEAGVYDVTLVAINSWNCPDTFSIPAAVTAEVGGDLQFPNAFTPGGGGPTDGTYDPNSFENDFFFPIYKGVKDYRLQVFNRWGEMVFESTDVRRGWDGYYRGIPAKQDVYAWKAYAKFSDGREKVLSGDVTLLR